MRNLEHLIRKCASDSLGVVDPSKESLEELSRVALGEQLVELLTLRNGFMAFESSLHIFPISGECQMTSLDWNSDNLWKSDYKIPLPKFFCFGENIFGEQFCTSEGKVCRFDPETGALEELTSSIDAWAELILTESDLHTGFPLAHEWQVRNGPLSLGYRLVPRTPFVCGGEFTIDNLVSMNAMKGMRSRANLANQIHELPDGTEIHFEIVN